MNSEQNWISCSSLQTVRRPFDTTRSTHLGVVPLLVGFESGDCLGSEQESVRSRTFDEEKVFAAQLFQKIMNTFSLQLFGEQR